jgi:hypothetical protein
VSKRKILVGRRSAKAWAFVGGDRTSNNYIALSISEVAEVPMDEKQSVGATGDADTVVPLELLDSSGSAG